MTGLVRRFRANFWASFGADLRVGLIVFAVVVFLGLPAGLGWEALSPTAEVVSRPEGVFYTNPEGSDFIAADGWFAVIGAVTGLICSAAAFFRYRRHGVAAVLALAVGGVLASLLAWRLGHLLGPDDLEAGAAAARSGVPFSGPLDLRAHGVLLVWPLASTTVFLALTAGHDAAERHPVPAPAQVQGPEAAAAGDGGRDDRLDGSLDGGPDGGPGERRVSPWAPPGPAGRWAPSEPGEPDQVRGRELDVQPAPAGGDEHVGWSSALASTTVGSRRRWPSGLIPPAT